MINSVKDLLRKLKLLPLFIFIYKRIINFFGFFLFKNLARQKRILIEFGSGNKKGKNGWTTVDLFGSDINYDITRGIPLSDNSVDKIYSSHLLEHLSFDQINRLLGECYRILKINGEFSVCVPNSRLYIEAYINNEYFNTESTLLFSPAIIKTGSKIDQVNYIAYMNGEHKYLWDQENLINSLGMAGFKNAKLRDYDENLDLFERHFESIYAVAYKLAEERDG